MTPGIRAALCPASRVIDEFLSPIDSTEAVLGTNEVALFSVHAQALSQLRSVVFRRKFLAKSYEPRNLYAVVHPR